MQECDSRLLITTAAGLLATAYAAGSTNIGRSTVDRLPRLRHIRRLCKRPPPVTGEYLGRPPIANRLLCRVCFETSDEEEGQKGGLEKRKVANGR